MGKDNVANCDQEPRATVAPSDQSEAGLTVSGLKPDEAADLVKARERSGHDASTMHIEGDELAPGTGASARNDPIASNDHANLVSVGRPAALAALIGGLALGAVLAVGALLVGAGANAAVLAGLGGAIVGLVVGALVGMYSGVVINSDVIDLRGQQPAHDVSVRLGQVGQPTNGPPPIGYVAEHQANEHQANQHHEEPNRRG